MPKLNSYMMHLFLLLVSHHEHKLFGCLWVINIKQSIGSINCNSIILCVLVFIASSPLTRSIYIDHVIICPCLFCSNFVKVCGLLVEVNLRRFNPSHFCARPKPGTRFPSVYVIISVFKSLRVQQKNDVYCSGWLYY